MRRSRRSVFFGSIPEVRVERPGTPALEKPLATASRNLETTAL
jgi:hypothetical protein